ncbi:Outer Dynein Arm Docking Complex [Phytophthora infestans T30-4]|uniref:Outer Dynein Arm Docking Complex n=1 Tax=Phytophthora infestans (strain T30-4) TaxID=403677 RepID=D0MW95_PHYIT|nr:Outer Dynein Arm Docking Complex [Phytophthora infestans T30-4]EEY63908.1 Outer Dynein Arm Docking Complex [Phytophthora infestans T30-4]|eukprot:XP_002907344.1 Outer Dynein Arm Docking Complex [Phytophthora infestans T30-4]
MHPIGGNNGADLTQLQREYRNMELNRKVYADESHQVMRRQQTVIEKLRKDNEEMKAELTLAERHINEGAVAQQQEHIARLQDQIDNYNRKNVAEAKRLETLTQQIQVMRHKVLHQKKHMGGVNAAKENQQMISKQIRILENRLDKSLVKFNEALAQNKVLREEIDNLRRERVVFDTIYRKLEREHGDKKRQMAQTIELSNQAYEQRDAAQLELRSLQEENRAELDAHRRALTELMERLEESKILADTTNYRRGASSAGGAPGASSDYAGNMSREEENEMKRKVQKGTWGVAKEKVHVQVSIERVQNFEEAFMKIKAATRIDDLEQLVTSFIKKEDQNFSLFNYVNEQSNEIEKLEEWIAALRDEERRYGDGANGVADENGVGQHKQLLRDLETRLALTEQAAEKCETRCAEAQKTVNTVKRAIQNLFTKTGCNAQAMVEMLGDSVVTEANMMAYLGVIEQKTNEILHQYAAVVTRQQADAQKSKPTSDAYDRESQFAAAVGAAGGTNGAVATLHSILGVGPIAPMGQEPLQINPPNLDDYSSEGEDSGDNDDAMHPLTRDELKVRTLKGMRRLNHANVPQPGIGNNANFNAKRAANATFATSTKLRK